METGNAILTILLLIIVVALGFSYSDEVSRNRHLYLQLKRGLHEPELVARMRGLYKDIDELRQDNRNAHKEIGALERTIALKDEKIRDLKAVTNKLKFDYAVEVARRNETEEDQDGEVDD